MNNQCKFKEGDKVKKLNGMAFSNGEFVATVEAEDNYGKVWFKETLSWLDKGAICLVNKPFTKSSLKDGMVVTYRESYESNNLKRVVFKGSLYKVSEDGMSMLHGVYLKYFSDTLEYDNDEDMDIMKVEYMGEVLWEREDDTKKKRIKELQDNIAKMQEELNKLL